MTAKGTRAKNGEGSVYFLQSTKSWMVSFTDNDGRRKARKSPKQTERGAQAHLTALMRERDEGRSQVRSPTLAQFVPTWLEAKRVAGCRPRTLEAYEARITLHVVPSLGAMRLAKITPTDIERLYGRLLAPPIGLSPTTVHAIHNALRNLLRAAHRKRLVPFIPTEMVEPPKAERHEARTLSVAEAQQLMAGVKGHRHGPLWTFLLGTGCRFGEAAGLTWGAVDLGNGTARIRQQISRELDRATGRRQHVPAPVKTDAGKRTVHLAQWVINALREQAEIIETTLQLDQSHLDSDAYVFPNRDGGPLRENHVLENWHHMLRSIGLEGKPGQAPLRQHDLRHTVGTLLADSGEDTTTIQRILGHAKQSITADLYIGNMHNNLRRASDRYSSLLAPEEGASNA